MSTSDDGSLIRHAIVLHNNKRVTSDRVQQSEQYNKRNWKHYKVTVISVNKVWHHILKNSENITNMNFVMI